MAHLQVGSYVKSWQSVEVIFEDPIAFPHLTLGLAPSLSSCYGLVLMCYPHPHA